MKSRVAAWLFVVGGCLVLSLGGPQMGPQQYDNASSPDASDSDPWERLEHELLAVAQAPGSAEAHCKLGFAYLDLLGYTDQAFAAFDRAISLKSDYAEAYRGLGWASIELNSFSKVIATGGRGIMNPSRLAKADEAFSRAIALDPVDAEAHFGLAMAFTAQERYAEAIESALQAALLRPDSSDPYHQLCLIYYHMGNFDEAARALEKAIHLERDGLREETRLRPDRDFDDDKPGDYLFLGDLHAQADEHSKALEAYLKMAGLDPFNPAVHHRLALAYYATGDYHSATNHYRALVSSGQIAHEHNALIQRYENDLRHRIRIH